MRIRSATGADVAAVLELWSSARSSGATTSDNEEVVLRLIERDPGALLVAEDDGQLIGTLIVGWDGWRGNSYRLAVAPDRRRQGIAKRLISEGEERLKALGGQRATALVWRADAPASSVWTAAGYADNAGVARHVRNL